MLSKIVDETFNIPVEFAVSYLPLSTAFLRCCKHSLGELR